MNSPIKITGTRSYILVEFETRSVKIQGELTTTPAFYAVAGSIRNWESPYEDIVISPAEKAAIIEGVLAYDSRVKIIFIE